MEAWCLDMYDSWTEGEDWVLDSESNQATYVVDDGDNYSQTLDVWVEHWSSGVNFLQIDSTLEKKNGDFGSDASNLMYAQGFAIADGADDLCIECDDIPADVQWYEAVFGLFFPDSGTAYLMPACRVGGGEDDSEGCPWYEGWNGEAGGSTFVTSGERVLDATYKDIKYGHEYQIVGGWHKSVDDGTDNTVEEHEGTVFKFTLSDGAVALAAGASLMAALSF